MRITKYGHSCLLVEEGEARILIDPGAFSSGQNSVRGIDAVLITHEHADHLSPDSVRAVLANNPGAAIYTNQGAGAVLEKEGIPFSVLGDGQSAEVKGVLVEGFGVDHACIHESIPIIRNTGYRIAKRLFYGGDALSAAVSAEILALPVAAPWMKISEALDFAIAMKPKVAFPVHDAILRRELTGFIGRMAEGVLKPNGIEFRDMTEGSVEEF